jgi:hypothetical protein
MMVRLTHQFSAQNLNAHNTDAKVDRENAVSDWIENTPTRDNFALTKQSSSTKLTVETSAGPGQILEEAPRSAGLAEKVKWHQLMAENLEIEIKLVEASGQSASEKHYLLLRHHGNRAAKYQIELATAHKDAQDASGGLAEPTANYPPTSPGTPYNSDDWPSKANGSSVESDMIAPEVDDRGQIQRSVSKNREGKATHISQKTPRHHGNVGEFDEEVDSSTRECATASAEAVLRSPKLINSTHTHGHPPQRAVMRPTYGQHNSCAEDEQYNGEHRYHYENSYNAGTLNFASQAGVPEENNEVFSPRDRGYQYRPGPYGGAGFWFGSQQK